MTRNNHLRLCYIIASLGLLLIGCNIVMVRWPYISQLESRNETIGVALSVGYLLNILGTLLVGWYAHRRRADSKYLDAVGLICSLCGLAQASSLFLLA